MFKYTDWSGGPGLESWCTINWRRQWYPIAVLLPRKSHGWRSLVGCSPWGCSELDMTEQLHFHFSLSHIGEGNGNPLQCSCLENPRDGEPGGLPSVGSHRAGHDWSDLAAAAAAAVPFISSVSLVPEFLSLQNEDIRNLSDFPGGPVVKIRASNAGGSGSILEWGIKIPHDSQHGQKIKNKKKRPQLRVSAPER